MSATTYISKEQSTRLKGFAILIMLYLHLFNHYEPQVSSLGTLFGQPLYQRLAYFCNICVGLYIFISGYGLYIVRHKGGHLRRVGRLYRQYLLVFALFVPAAHCINPARYGFRWTEFVGNLTGVSVTYNEEWWFLLPWSALALLSPYLMRQIDRRPWWLVLAVTGSLHYTITACNILYADFMPFLYDHRWLMQLINIPFLSFMFAVGALTAKHNVFGRFAHYTARWGSKRQLYLCLLLLLLIAFRLCVTKTYLAPFIIVPFALIVTTLTYPRPVSRLLEALGRASTGMWLVHTFFCTYLFHDFIYAFRYPPLILLVLTSLSYATARAVMWADNRLSGATR